MLAGLDPVYGIYTVIFPAILYGVIGNSRQGAIGPMSVPCLVIAAVVEDFEPADMVRARLAWWEGV